jgi:hypothetical protein
MNHHPVKSQLQTWLSRLEAYASARAYLMLAVLVSLTFIGGTFILRASPANLHSGETMTWWSIALNLVRGYGYSLCNQYYFPFCSDTNSLTAMREPAPVLLFAGVALLFKESLLAAGIIELILMLGILVALFFLTREWTGSSLAGLLAALGWAVYPRAMTLISQVSGDLLAALGVTIGLFFVLRARRTDHLRDWLLAGAGLGIAILSRSAMLMVALTVIAGLVIERWGLRSRLWIWLRPALLAGAVVAAFLTPWLVRTQLAFGRPLIGSSLVGYNIYRHNYAIGTNDYFRYISNNEAWAAVQALVARRTDLLGTENEAQMDVVYRDEGLKIIFAHPVQYVLLSGYRFFMLWFDWRVSEGFGYPMGATEYTLMAVQAILLALAWLGLRTNLRGTWPLWASLILVTLAYMAVDSRMFYTGPVMPLVISMSAVGAIQIARKFT